MMFSVRFAAFGLIILLSLITVFHLSVLIGIIPFNIVWGGRLAEHSQMVIFESVSITINLLMIATVGLKAKLIFSRVSPKFIRIALWIMAGVFVLNTIGNLASVNTFEKIIFTPVTAILAVLSIRLALSGD